MNGSSPSQGRDASAYRVAHLLQRSSANENDFDTSSLRRLTAEIGSFLEVAPQAPPVYMEAPAESTRTTNAHSCSSDQTSHKEQPEVELNVVAGVFEEKPPVTSGASGRGDRANVLLPTEATKEKLLARKAEEAQALLDLVSALTPSSATATAPSRDGPVIDELHTMQHGVRPNKSNTETNNEDEDDDDDSGVVVMDADDLANEESSDDEMPVQRRRVIEEMN